MLMCPNCRYHTFPDGNKAAVIAEWCGANKIKPVGDQEQHLQTLWSRQYKKQAQQGIGNAA